MALLPTAGDAMKLASNSFSPSNLNARVAEITDTFPS